MGQYFVIVNVDTEEVVDTRNITPCGSKLWEHVINGGGAFMSYLMAAGPGRANEPTEYRGRWVGDEVMVVGDYYDDYPEDENGMGLYRQALGYRLASNYAGETVAPTGTEGPVPSGYSVDETVEGWTDITEEIVAEMNEFLGEEKYEVRE